MEEVQYPSVGACLRAPRFVVAYRPDSDWVITARHVIRTLSRIWAGAGAVILPAEKQASGIAGLAGLIRSYDPDVIAGHVPLPAGGGRADEADRQGGDGSGTPDPALPWHLQSRMIYADAWEDVARLADEWSSPYKGVHHHAASFSAHEIIDMDWHADSYQYLTVMPPLADEPPLVTLDLDGIDPVVALMVESRTGALHAHDQAGPSTMCTSASKTPISSRWCGWPSQARPGWSAGTPGRVTWPL